MPRLETDRDKAIVLLNVAFERLRASGTPEDFFTLAQLVGATRFGSFFAAFGDEYGVFLEIKVEDQPSASGILELSFGVRPRKQSFFKRMREAIKMSWAIMWHRPPVYSIRLPSSDVTKFKDMLRTLNQWT